MCGILTIINKKQAKVDRDVIESMSSIIRHRGPDDEGFLVVNKDCEDVYCGKDTIDSIYKSPLPYACDKKLPIEIEFDLLLAHRRLSILDISEKGHQPMCDENKRYWITYNGEVYNYKGIKKELVTLGYEFLTDTDTEVILKAFIEWGEKCQKKFNGVWAIVIYDSQTKNIWVSRDRLGEKPLYYYEDKEWLIFCSEPKQLLPLINLEKNTLEIAAIMVTKTVATHIKETVFRNVYRFPSANYSTFNLANPKLTLNCFWKIKINNDLNQVKYNKQQGEIYANEFERLMNDSVELRMNSDVEVGAMLSGGIDSNIIVSIMSKLHKNKLKVFSSVFDEFEPELQEKNELSKIRLAEKKYSLDITYVQFEYNFKDFLTLFSSMLWHYDSPCPWIGDGAVLLVQQAKRKGVSVVLGGQGADEVLAGYDSFWVFNLEKKLLWKKLFKKTNISIGILFKSLLFSNKIFGWFHPFLFEIKYKNNAKLLGIKWTKELSNYLKYRNYTNPKMTLSEALKVSVEKNLSYLLYGDDRHAMQCSVESRLPFTDYRLIEFLFNLPDDYKMHDGYTKYISRLAFNKKLPKEIIWNKNKIGFEGSDKFYLDTNSEFRNTLIDYLGNIDKKTNYQKLYDKDYSLFIAKMANVVFLQKYGKC